MTPTEWALLSQKERASWVVENLGAGHTGNLKQATTEVLMKLVHGSIKELQRRWEESQENTLAAAKAIWPDLRKALGQKARRIGRNGFAEPLVTEWANQPVVPTEGWSGRKPKTRAKALEIALKFGDGHWATIGELWLWVEGGGPIVTRTLQKFGYLPGQLVMGYEPKQTYV